MITLTASRVRLFFKDLLFTLIIVTVFFGLLEFGLGAIGVQPLILTEDPLVGFAANVPQFIETTRADGTVIMRTALNKRIMFNYQEFPKVKAGNSYRVFCMGGSTTYGRPYSDKLSFCGWLRAYLKAADPSRNWEIINAGGVSFASYRVAKLMNELKQYHPDLFIVYTGQNEFLEQRSYGMLMNLPSWLINLNATLSGTRTYTALKKLIDPLMPVSIKKAQERYKLSGEVDEILNHTIGPKSYHRDDALKRQIITHFRLNLVRMVKIARSVDAGIIFVQPAKNLKDMSPFKSEHRDGLDAQGLKNWQALFQRATVLDASGDIPGALAAYHQALAIDDRYSDLHYRIGQDLFKLKRYDEAEKAFRRAVEEDIVPLRILGSMQQDIREVAASENVPLVDFPSILRKAYLSRYDYAIFGKEYFRDHVHTNIEGYRLLGQALFAELIKEGIAQPKPSWNEARMEQVRQEVLAGVDSSVEGRAMLNLGKVLDWAGKFEEACNAFKQALAILGPSPLIYDELTTCTVEIKKYDQTVRYLNEALVLYPGMPGVHYKLAMVLRMQGKTDEAIDQCQAELELNPGNENAHYALANLLVEKGDAAGALEQFRLAVQIKPRDEQARVKLADLLIMQGRYDEALPHAQEALRINPKQYRAHDALGLVLKHQGKFDEAISQFSEALRLEPGDADATKNLEELQSGHHGAAHDDEPLKASGQ
jgi:tetratricopeptide (TPR) repeat protein